MRIFQELALDQMEIKERDIVFDLDGTLIEGDIGETLYFHTLLTEFMQEDRNRDWLQPIHPTPDNHAVLLSAEGAKLIKAYHEELSSGDYAEAYLNTARRLEKYPKNDIEKLTQAFLSEQSLPKRLTCRVSNNGRVEKFNIAYGIRVRQEMKGLVNFLNGQGASIWIVSASPQMACESVAGELGIDLDQVMGTFASEKGDGCQRFPWGPKKLEILLDRSVTHPLFVFGDGEGDLEMLDIAEYPVVVEGNANKILKYALEKNWWIYQDGLEP